MKRVATFLMAALMVVGLATDCWAPPGMSIPTWKQNRNEIVSPVINENCVAVGGTNTTSPVLLCPDGTGVFTGTVTAPLFIGAGGGSGIPYSEKGAANGVATLDASAKLTYSEIPDSLLGGVSFQGTYDVPGDSPPLPACVTTTIGYYYIASVAGTLAQPNYEYYDISDWVVCDATGWSKVDNVDSVTSVNGRIGDVVGLEEASNKVQTVVTSPTQYPSSTGVITYVTGQITSHATTDIHFVMPELGELTNVDTSPCPTGYVLTSLNNGLSFDCQSASGGTVGASTDWSLYPAIQDVNMGAFSFTNLRNIGTQAKPVGGSDLQGLWLGPQSLHITGTYFDGGSAFPRIKFYIPGATSPSMTLSGGNSFGILNSSTTIFQMDDTGQVVFVGGDWTFSDHNITGVNSLTGTANLLSIPSEINMNNYDIVGIDDLGGAGDYITGVYASKMYLQDAPETSIEIGANDDVLVRASGITFALPSTDIGTQSNRAGELWVDTINATTYSNLPPVDSWAIYPAVANVLPSIDSALNVGNANTQWSGVYTDNLYTQNISSPTTTLTVQDTIQLAAIPHKIRQDAGPTEVSIEWDATTPDMTLTAPTLNFVVGTFTGLPGADLSTWAAYPASQTVDMDIHDLTDVHTIYMNKDSALGTYGQIRSETDGNTYSYVDVYNNAHAVALVSHYSDFDHAGITMAGSTETATFYVAPSSVPTDWTGLYLSTSGNQVSPYGAGLDNLGASTRKWNNLWLDSTAYINALEDVEDGDIILTAHITPSTASTYDLGSPTNPFANVYADNIVASGVSGINVADWATYPAVQNVDMDGNGLTNINAIVPTLANGMQIAPIGTPTSSFQFYGLQHAYTTTRNGFIGMTDDPSPSSTGPVMWLGETSTPSGAGVDDYIYSRLYQNGLNKVYDVYGEDPTGNNWGAYYLSISTSNPYLYMDVGTATNYIYMETDVANDTWGFEGHIMPISDLTWALGDATNRFASGYVYSMQSYSLNTRILNSPLTYINIQDSLHPNGPNLYTLGVARNQDYMAGVYTNELSAEHFYPRITDITLHGNIIGSTAGSWNIGSAAAYMGTVFAEGINGGSSLAISASVINFTANTFTGLPSGADAWSQYPATQNVDMDGNSLINVGDPLDITTLKARTIDFDDPLQSANTSIYSFTTATYEGFRIRQDDYGIPSGDYNWIDMEVGAGNNHLYLESHEGNNLSQFWMYGAGYVRYRTVNATRGFEPYSTGQLLGYASAKWDGYLRNAYIETLDDTDNDISLDAHITPSVADTFMLGSSLYPFSDVYATTLRSASWVGTTRGGLISDAPNIGGTMFIQSQDENLYIRINQGDVSDDLTIENTQGDFRLNVRNIQNVTSAGEHVAGALNFNDSLVVSSSYYVATNRLTDFDATGLTIDADDGNSITITADVINLQANTINGIQEANTGTAYFGTWENPLDATDSLAWDTTVLHVLGTSLDLNNGDINNVATLRGVEWESPYDPQWHLQWSASPDVRITANAELEVTQGVRLANVQSTGSLIEYRSVNGGTSLYLVPGGTSLSDHVGSTTQPWDSFHGLELDIDTIYSDTFTSVAFSDDIDMNNNDLLGADILEGWTWRPPLSSGTAVTVRGGTAVTSVDLLPDSAMTSNRRLGSATANQRWTQGWINELGVNTIHSQDTAAITASDHVSFSNSTKELQWYINGTNDPAFGISGGQVVVKDDGDTTWTPVKYVPTPPAYAGLYNAYAATDITLTTTANVWQTVAPYYSGVNEEIDATLLDAQATTGYFVVGTGGAGTYEVHCDFEITSNTNNTALDVAVHHMYGATSDLIPWIHEYYPDVDNGVTVEASMSGLHTVTDADWFAVRIRTQNGSTPYLPHITFWVARMND